MKQLLLAFFLFPTLLSAAEPMPSGVLSGFIRDKSNGESLPYANIFLKEEKIGGTSNLQGYYVIPKMPPGRHTVRVSLLGYKAVLFTLESDGVTAVVKNVDLEPQAIQAGEVVISAEQIQQQQTTQTGRILMKAKDLESLPSIGEADVFRALQTMPGVKAISDISSGLYVRGGSSDQNLILLDGTVVYNPSHLFGFFSTFNNDAIKDAELIKGGLPAEYGGRLSSVLNVTNIDGNRNEFHGKGSVSLISSRLTGEGPLGNGSWFLSGRRTYFDVFMRAAGLDKGKDPLPLYYFYDANGKINQDFGQDDKVSLVTYFGQDNLTFNPDKSLGIAMWWGNQTVATKWTHVFSPTVFSNFIATYSHYKAHTEFDFGGVKYIEENGVTDYSLKGDLNFYVTNEHLLKTGIWWSQYNISYSERFGGGDSYSFLERPAQISFYLQDEWSPSPVLTLNGGVRGEYQDASRSVRLGPRLATRYHLTEDISLKLAGGVYYQFLNSVPIGGDNGFNPFEVWVPINRKMNPSRSMDVVAGVELQPMEGQTLSVEGYYKSYKDVLYWIGQATRTTDVNELFYTGTGRAFGTEFFLQHRFGRLTGSIGYSLSWTYLQFPDDKEYMPKYDRRHDVSVTANYALDEKWKFGLIYSYATGQAYTLGVGRYVVRTPERQYDVILPGDIYNRRLEPYYRLDFSVTKKMTMFGLKGNWYVQIFNLTSHRNVWFKQFDTKKNPTEVTNVRLLPIIPTFGCDFEF
ncbi:MAG: TonB-dependent receptor [Ignavibacteriales bacterium]|nr:TonB-dependent receptor [Ignavibacteriales bacterium]